MVLQTKFAQVRDNTLYIDDVNAMDLVKQYGTPLYVMSEGHIRQQLSILKEHFMDKYENTLPLFASKSFSCQAIYKLASEYGVGIDCVSGGEISIALSTGFDPEKIYFHGNNKLPSEIEYALKHGVNHFVIDNFYEIELIEKSAIIYGEDNINDIIDSTKKYNGNNCIVIKVKDLVPEYLESETTDSNGYIEDVTSKGNYLDEKNIIIYLLDENVKAKYQTKEDICS